MLANRRALAVVAVTANLQFYLTVLVALHLCVHTSSGSGEQQCGKILPRPRPTKLSGKIVGGYEVGYYKYPWFAVMQYNEETLCGGALIAPNVILTAAHCFDPFRSHDWKLEDVYTVILGANDQCKEEATQRKYTTVKVIIHEDYMENKPYYDIALLTLSGDTSNYDSVCLPPKPLSDDEQAPEARVIGFGSMQDGPGSYPCELREARILLYDNRTCVDMIKLHTSAPKEYAFINALCAGYKDGGVDSCSGDSGGPLMTMDTATSTWHTVGIVSFGWSCGKKDSMGIYTDVSQYLDWIEENSGIKAQPDPPKPNLTSNPIVDAVNAYLDRAMNSSSESNHAPKEIVITFKV